MSPSAVVIMCALDLLGGTVSTLPPIRVLDSPPTVVSPNAQAFVDRSEGVIYMIASAPAFREAVSAQYTPALRGLCRPRAALKIIASVIAHELWHVEHGPDERGAYQAQLGVLIRLGLGETWAFADVRRSMGVALNRQALRSQIR
ncbi:MAG TPA: hypothetical protein VI485_31155 [Vicinamibacterales bacterium]|nr:hypothetical protein [Vicinamibacterales bacterium]